MKMSRQVGNLQKCIESASLILLCKDTTLSASKIKSAFDYKVLLFKRSKNASFMPNSAVFPGGVHENADSEKSLWMKHLHSFGVTNETLKELRSNTFAARPRPNIFKTIDEDCLQKEISLRITAIRETFEEVGILLCRDREALADGNYFGSFKENFDRLHWQRVVHNDPTQFLALCRELEVVPDLWSLHEWSAWATPSTFAKRFETAFYIVAVQETPNLILEKQEVGSFAWKTPLDYLKAYVTKELWLPPPQLYELSRLLNTTELQQLMEFARIRSRNGSILALPVQYQCTDGMVSLLPGDDMYPSDPIASSKPIKTQLTMQQFRSDAKKLNRAEFVDPYSPTIHLNFSSSDGHLSPVNFNSDET